MGKHNEAPFFIVGCVRSGTTMLRNLLRKHPRLECPEETHFFRWADPFASNRYDMVYTKNKLIADQQALDGFTREEFFDLYDKATDRRELMDSYMAEYLAKRGAESARWFDKTPQHVYGLFLIRHAYPDAKFIHIHRNPLNVCASLLQGKVMPKHKLVGAVNYWNEAMILVNAFKRVFSDVIYELSYEEFCEEPEKHLPSIFNFIGEDMGAVDYGLHEIHPEKNKYRDVLNQEQVRFVIEKCREFMTQYGYA